MASSGKGSRIPIILSKFDKYIQSSVNFLGSGGPPNNGTRLGLTAAEITQAQTFLSHWRSGNPAAPGVYDLHSDPNTKNKTTRKNVMKLIKDFSTFFKPLLNTMAANPAITNADRLVLNIAEPNSSRTHQQVAIGEQIFFQAKQLGGGDIRITCRSTSDSKRASKPKHADTVQLAFKVGDPAPAGPDDAACKKEVFSKAILLLKLGASLAAQKVYIYARWYNTKRPELAGPWGPVNVIVIA